VQSGSHAELEAAPGAYQDFLRLSQA